MEDDFLVSETDEVLLSPTITAYIRLILDTKISRNFIYFILFIFYFFKVTLVWLELTLVVLIEGNSRDNTDVPFGIRNMRFSSTEW